MPIRRILKFTPVVVLVLLVVAWVVSWFAFWGFGTNYGPYRSISAVASTVQTVYYRPGDANEPAGLEVQRNRGRWTQKTFTGHLDCSVEWPLFLSIYAPYPLIISAVLPLAIGPFISFRFRLWHHLAYTALIAVELAYYLQWQE
jgi:hypothetical protein